MRRGWADAIADQAVEPRTAARLIAQLAILEDEALAFCRLLERWARGGPSHRRRAAARRGAPGAAERVERALLGARAAARPLPASARARAPAEGRSWFGEPGQRRARRLGAGARAGRRRGRAPPGRRRLPRARGADPGARRARRRRSASTRAPTAGSLWAGLFDLRENLLGPAPRTTCRRSPPSAGAMADPVELTVVGSINVDFVARMERLPQPRRDGRRPPVPPAPGRQGREPGGRRGPARRAREAGRRRRRRRARRRGARAALLARRRRARGRAQTGQTGVALIYVDAAGENEIAVFPGANAAADAARGRGGRALPARGARRGRPAPPRPAPPSSRSTRRRPARSTSSPTCSSSTGSSTRSSSARQARRGHPRQGRRRPLRGRPPGRRLRLVEIVPRDGTGAGDAFTACLVVSLLEGRPHEEALRRACTAGRLRRRDGRRAELAADERRPRGVGEAALTRDHPRLRPRPRRRDRTPARARLARAGAARRDDRRRQPDDREDDHERPEGARVRRPRRGARSRRARPTRSCAARSVAAHVHGESGLDGPELPPPAGAARRGARRRLPGAPDRERAGAVTLVPSDR